MTGVADGAARCFGPNNEEATLGHGHVCVVCLFACLFGCLFGWYVRSAGSRPRCPVPGLIDEKDSHRHSGGATPQTAYPGVTYLLLLVLLIVLDGVRAPDVAVVFSSRQASRD